MKTAIGLAVAFVGVLALIARSSEDAPEASGTKPVAAVLPTPSVPFAVPNRSLRAAETPVVSPAASAVEVVQASAQAPTPGLLTAGLDHELGLSETQRGRVEEIFRARELAVGAIQRRVLQAGYIHPGRRTRNSSRCARTRTCRSRCCWTGSRIGALPRCCAGT